MTWKIGGRLGSGFFCSRRTSTPKGKSWCSSPSATVRSNTIEEVIEGRVVRQVTSHRHEIDEVTDQILDLGTRPARHRCADDDVALASVATEQTWKAARKAAYRLTPAGLTKSEDLGRQLRLQVEVAGRAAEALGHRPREISRQIKDRERPASCSPSIPSASRLPRLRPSGFASAAKSAYLHRGGVERSRALSSSA